MSALLARQHPRQLAAGYVPGPLPRARPTDPAVTPVPPRRRELALGADTDRRRCSTAKPPSPTNNPTPSAPLAVTEVPTLIRGELDSARPLRRATLRVPPATASLQTARPAARFAIFDNALGEREPNAMYNSVLQSVDVVIGAANAGAVGVHWRGAQGSGLEDVSVRFEGGGPGDGLVGARGGAGSGGAHHGVTVIGGRYGLDLRDAQPVSTITRATLLNQTCATLLCEGYESLSAVGVTIGGFRTAIAAGLPNHTNLAAGPRPPSPPPSPKTAGGFRGCTAIIAGFQRRLPPGSTDAPCRRCRRASPTLSQRAQPPLAGEPHRRDDRARAARP